MFRVWWGIGEHLAKLQAKWLIVSCAPFALDFLLQISLLSLTAKEFWKSVNIWWSYGQEFGVLFFGSQCRHDLVSTVIVMQNYCSENYYAKCEPNFLSLMWSEMFHTSTNLRKFMYNSGNVSAYSTQLIPDLKRTTKIASHFSQLLYASTWADFMTYFYAPISSIVGWSGRWVG